jgi:hypothetical protein
VKLKDIQLKSIEYPHHYVFYQNGKWHRNYDEPIDHLNVKAYKGISHGNNRKLKMYHDVFYDCRPDIKQTLIDLKLIDE